MHDGNIREAYFRVRRYPLHSARPKIKLYYSYVRNEIGYLGANGGVCYSTITFRIPKEYEFIRLYEPTNDVALLRSRWYCARKTV